MTTQKTCAYGGCKERGCAQERLLGLDPCPVDGTPNVQRWRPLLWLLIALACVWLLSGCEVTCSTKFHEGDLVRLRIGGKTGQVLHTDCTGRPYLVRYIDTDLQGREFYAKEWFREFELERVQ